MESWNGYGEIKIYEETGFHPYRCIYIAREKKDP